MTTERCPIQQRAISRTLIPANNVGPRRIDAHSLESDFKLRTNPEYACLALDTNSAIKMVMNGLLSSFVAAVQASLSVLLVISYGGIAAKLGLLNSSNGKAISKICVKMFLPALLLTQIGSELHTGSAHRYLIVLLWAFICHFISFLIGIAAHLLFGLPDWVTAAIMFNNTTSYPLLLIQSLDETGISTLR